VLFFLVPIDIKRQSLINSIKKKLACESIRDDKSIKLSESQESDIENIIKKEKNDIPQLLKEVYRMLIVPGKEELKSLDLGIPVFGDKTNLPAQVLKKLKSESIILEKFAPIALKEKYLKNKEHVLINQIYDAFLKTPGELILVSKSVLETCIKEGVKQGSFGFGKLEGTQRQILSWKEVPSIKFKDDEILIEASICEKLKDQEPVSDSGQEPISDSGQEPVLDSGQKPISGSGQKPVLRPIKSLTTINLKSFIIPKGKVFDIAKLLSELQRKFENIEITIKIKAEVGEITKEEFENSIKEGLKQLNIDI
jgi:hypothetical protein